MPEPFAGMTDVLLGYDTDFHFENGDLMLTSGIDYIEREIFKLLITSPNDWGANPQIGASPDRFIGEQNTREVGSAIKNYLQTRLRDTAFPAQLNVRVVPTDYTSITIFIEVFVQNSEITNMSFSFDFVTGGIQLLNRDERTTPVKSSPNLKVNDINSKKVPNKYWENIRDDYITR
jgi:hypothetical protein